MRDRVESKQINQAKKAFFLSFNFHCFYQIFIILKRPVIICIQIIYKALKYVMQSFVLFQDALNNFYNNQLVCLQPYEWLGNCGWHILFGTKKLWSVLLSQVISVLRSSLQLYIQGQEAPQKIAAYGASWMVSSPRLCTVTLHTAHCTLNTEY